jgi:peptide/nickel transport system ATP-binding protein
VMGARKRARIHLEGALPNAMNVPKGCRFHPRCAHRLPICSAIDPALERKATGRTVACHLYS